MSNASRRLGERLVDRKVLSRDTLEALLEREVLEGIPLTRLLVADHVVAEKDLVAAVADQMGVRFVDLATTWLDPSVAPMVPEEIAREHSAVAVRMEGDKLLVAMADPSDHEAVRKLAQASGHEILAAVGERTELSRALDGVYGRRANENGNGSADASGELRIAVDDAPPTAPMPTIDFGGELHVNELLERVLDLGGSDLHLTAGIHPVVRVHGELKPLTEFPMMTGSELRRMIYAVLTAKQREKFESELELDTSHGLPRRGRFRVNVFLQRDSIGAVMRAIPSEIVPLEQLGLPPVVSTLAHLPRGLVLVTGPTGSGKSTTLASLLDIVNSNRAVHIMTVEDPIEFLHHHKVALVNQREVGEDTYSFANALKHVLRQDPDVILVGEMRDLETIATALTAAETGHLVFATLHTQDAPQAIDRVIDVFPAHQQAQVRVQLAASLQAVVTQQLLPTKGGAGRVVASEVLIATPAVRNLVREGKVHQIYSSMQAGGKFGMQTMDQALAHLVSSGMITIEVAEERCANAEDLRRLLGQG